MPLPQRQINAIDVSIAGEVESSGVSYINLPDDVFEFFKKCAEEKDVIGFEWSGDRRLGLILSK